MSDGLTIRALELRRGRRLLERSLSFDLAPGQFIELVGPNGSGKSTLLRVLAGLGRLERGEILWDGRPLKLGGDEHHARTLYLGHSDGLKGGFTAYENLNLFASLRQFYERTDEILEGLGYYGMKPLRSVPVLRLSQGQRRRIALTRLYAFPAALWLLDEPTTALDRSGIELFADHLVAHLARGGMALLATHQGLPSRLTPARRLELGHRP